MKRDLTSNRKEWLKYIEKDQELTSLDNIGLTAWDGLRRWFISKILNMSIDVAKYNAFTGKFELTGTEEFISSDATSAAAYTHTCPAHRKQFIEFIQAYDGTTAVSWSLEVLDVTGSYVKRTIYDAVAVNVGDYQTLVGTALWVDGAGTTHSALPNGFWLYPGESITLSATGFVPGDGMEFLITGHQMVI